MSSRCISVVLGWVYLVSPVDATWTKLSDKEDGLCMKVAACPPTTPLKDCAKFDYGPCGEGMAAPTAWITSTFEKVIFSKAANDLTTASDVDEVTQHTAFAKKNRFHRGKKGCKQ